MTFLSHSIYAYICLFTVIYLLSHSFIHILQQRRISLRRDIYSSTIHQLGVEISTITQLRISLDSGRRNDPLFLSNIK